jgi:hypothetical protein
MGRRHRTSFRVGIVAVIGLVGGLMQPWRLLAQAPEPAKGVKFAQVSPADLREWLTYLASDELQGRQVFTEGYGMAAQYIADLLKSWGVKPGGENGSYFQSVKLRDYRVIRNSSVTIDAGGQSRTFKHGDHVTFGVNSGGKQILTFSGVEFVGYGQAADLQGRDLKDKLVVWMPNTAPAQPGAGGGAARGGGGGGGGRGGAGRSGSAAAIGLGAKAAISFQPAPAAASAAEDALAKALEALAQANTAVTQAQQAVQQARGGARGGGAGGGRAGGGRGQQPPQYDVRTVQRVDGQVAPQFTADEAFFDALFTGAAVTFAELRAKAGRGEALLSVPLPAKVTVTIDNTFDIVNQQLTKNVVGIIEGSDPKLKETYVLYGAHLDHVGYSATGGGRAGDISGCRRRSAAAMEAVTAAGKTPARGTPAGARGGAAPAGGAARGGDPAAAGAGAGGGGAAGAGAGGAGAGGRAAAPPALPFDQRDIISNGADDDGSGSTAMLGVAKAFATGQKPKRSIILVWHTAEESGLLGSRYNADFPIVPLAQIKAHFNMDMVGRDDCNNYEGDYTNTVFVVGADRISTDLHNLIVQTNASMARPLTLDYELNDPADPEGVYTRSDHFSYAAKGIPAAFFTTGLHPDYHRVTDTAEKITYPKMARITQLIYQAGFAVANTERELERDNKGPRTGLGTKAEVIKK